MKIVLFDLGNTLEHDGAVVIRKKLFRAFWSIL